MVAGTGMCCIDQPSTSTAYGALHSAASMRIVSLPSPTIDRRGVPCAASGVRAIASGV
jgi:hypothetical protein